MGGVARHGLKPRPKRLTRVARHGLKAVPYSG